MVRQAHHVLGVNMNMVSLSNHQQHFKKNLHFMIKRLFDILVSTFGLLITSPILLPVLFLVWKQDRHSPFYVAPRVGKNGKTFKIIKIRSMVIHADKSGVDSTSADDKRITPVGSFIRAYKLDEVSQLINVLLGDMSLVGPRPNVQRDVDLYTHEERDILSIKPGITDISSIVFSDEGNILEGKPDPDLSYNQIIRPWKSRLALLYVKKRSFSLDVELIILTIIAIISKQNALVGIGRILSKLKADPQLISVCKRVEPLQPYPPPGSQEIIMSR